MRYYQDSCGRFYVDRGMGSFEPLGVVMIPSNVITEIAETAQPKTGGMSAQRRIASSNVVSQKPKEKPKPAFDTILCPILTRDTDAPALLEETSCQAGASHESCCNTAQFAYDLQNPPKK